MSRKNTPTPMQEFIKNHELSLRVTKHSARADGLMSDMQPGTSHYLCEVSLPTTHGAPPQLEQSFWYSMGPAHKDPPTLEDLLCNLQRDIQGTEQDFESWASDLGYDTDSRAAEKIYRACKRCAEKLRRLFGPEGLEEFLNVDTSDW